MLARGLVAVSLAVTGASALTKNCRPESSTTLAIWPLAPGAKTAEQTISVARTSHAAFAVRFTIVPLGKAHNNFRTSYRADSPYYRPDPVRVNIPSVLGTPPSSLPRSPDDGTSCESAPAGEVVYRETRFSDCV